LTPVESYAVAVVERELEPWTTEQMAQAEAEIEKQKRDWEQNHLKALHESDAKRPEAEPERPKRKSSGKTDASADKRAKNDDDENVDLTFSGADARNKVKKTPAKRPATKEIVVKLERADLRAVAKAVTTNHVSSESPRTRSAGRVNVNLWTLDTDPILPGVKPVKRKSDLKKSD
jgi:hypothetical protein